MTEKVKQRVCIKFCVKLEHSSAETIRMIQKVTAMGNWWLAASSQQHAHSRITSRAEFSAKHRVTQVTQPLLQPRFGALQLLSFSKTKITFGKEGTSDCLWDLGKYERAADCNSKKRILQCFERGTRSKRSERTVWDSKVPPLKRIDASLSYVQCFLCHVSSINVYICHTTWHI